MADKKPSTKKAEKTLAELLAEARQALLDAKKSLKAGELVNPRAVTVARKEVARILTKINANIDTNTKEEKA